MNNVMSDATTSSINADAHSRLAVGPWSNLALHTIGWKSFQDLCSQICEVTLRRPVEIFREAQDGGQDAVFLIPSSTGAGDVIGSVQCKHTSEPLKSMRLSDITVEIEHIRELVENGQADTYVLMTNMSVDAPVARTLRAKLVELGVRKPHVLGMQYLVRTIRSSPRLRALVPQVYGLGDLTSIIDERLSEQSRALLDHWIPKLKTYVPTRAHRSAVRVLSEHGIVLLLGNPSSGKSAIGAILSTIASENPNHTVLVMTSPRDFEAGWNPNDPGRFFWIDDAFGPNVLREDYVQDWASAFQKVRAAIGNGNKFLLTSRRHIYEAARKHLGQRNLAVFADGRAVVDVGVLSSDEKAQILYNHVNFGGQTQSWRSVVRDHLDAVAQVPEFLPGIAERLGDPAFTKSLIPRKDTLVRFMEEPREHLIDTINALDPVLQAALLLVYVHKGAFNATDIDLAASRAVADSTAIPLPRIQECFGDLKGSFLRGSPPGTPPIWSFAHPTIADALTEILREKPHMMAALLRGATIETILSGFACEGAEYIRDALTVPIGQNGTLVARLLQTPDEYAMNWSLFSFLAWRASDQVFEDIVRQAPEILERRTWAASILENDPKLRVHGRARMAGQLSEAVREESAGVLEAAVRDNYDLSFYRNEEVLGLLPAKRLVSLGMRLRAKELVRISYYISEISENADLDEDPESHFEIVAGALDVMDDAISDDDGSQLIAAARQKMAEEIRALTGRKETRDAEKEDDTDWSQISAVSESHDEMVHEQAGSRARSIFYDVDR